MDGRKKACVWVIAAFTGFFPVVCGAQNSAAKAYTISTLVAEGTLRQPTGLAVDAAGNLYIADQGNNVIRKRDRAGKMTIVAGVLGRKEKYPKFDRAAALASGKKIPDCTTTTGDNCVATKALFSGPRNLVLDAKGNIFVSDESASKIRLVHANTGKVTVLAGQTGGGWSPVQLRNPEGIALDGQGNLYVADKGNNAIRRIAPASDVNARGTMTTIAGRGPGIAGCAGEGALAKNAMLRAPEDVAVDADGNIYIADAGCRKIRRIGLDGRMQTVAGFDGPRPVPARLASGQPVNALEVSFTKPTGLKFGPDGKLYITDSSSKTVWLFDPENKTVRLIAGLTDGGKVCEKAANEYGDGCPATQARLNTPYRVAVDAQGNVYVPEQGGTTQAAHPYAIRVLRPAQ